MVVEQVHGMHGVTLQTPPRSDLFADFHGHATAKKFDPVINPVTAASPVTPTMFMPQPFMFPSPWFTPPALPSFPYGHPQSGFPATLHTTLGAPSRAEKHDLPSSDPPEGAFLEPYPEIDTFLNRLAVANPKRKLATYIELFETHDYYNVDDIANITLERLTTDPFNMTHGNAEFLLKEVVKEMKRVNQLRKGDSKRRRYY